MTVLSDRKLIWQLSLIGFFAIFSTTISKNPVLPLFAQAAGADGSVIGLISAVSPLAGIIFSFPIGFLSDRIGRRSLLILSGVVFLIAPLCYIAVVSPIWLIPIRFFHGTATAILGPLIPAMIAERFPETKGERIGQYSSATLIGRALAPMVGGIILTLFLTSPGYFRFYDVYLCGAIAAIPVLILILMTDVDRRSRPGGISLGLFKESLNAFFGDTRLRATAFVEMTTYFAFGAFETFVPIFLEAKGIDTYLTGIIFAAQVLVIAGTKPFFGKMADRIDKRIQIAGGLMLLGLPVGVISFCSSFPEFLLLSLVIGFGMSLSTVATSAYIADIARKGEMGASMGALSSIMDIGHSSGPLITGIVITIAGYTVGFALSTIIAIGITAMFIVSVWEI
ncbi:MAG: MFS transporter [Methanobacteriota archaeon]